MNKIVILLAGLLFTCLGAAQSLYDEGNFQSLVADKKAFRVGDPITILVVESARAESRAGTGSERGTNISASVSDSISSHSAGLGIGASSGGDAVTKRTGFLSAQLSVVVYKKDQNGLLYVKGEQSIIINGEEQKIQIDGAVRNEDVSRDNSVLSNRLLNAKIEFAGEGVVGNEQDTGVVYKVLSWLGLL